MLGAIAGDVIGSVHEHLGTKSMDFELFAADCRFTDDTVLAVAVADCLLNGLDYVDAFHEYFRAYPNAGYGGTFFRWARSGDRNPHNSWGNGAAMRVPAIQGTVPPALIAFLESTSFEDAVRKAISLGGDADTLACITGGVAEAYYGGLPADVESRTLAALDSRLREFVERFRERHGIRAGGRRDI